MRNKFARKAGSRRGVTVLVVLALVSLALAMSFAVLRSQATSVQMQQNHERRNSSRQAAQAGLAAGIRSMRLSNWGGVSSTLAANTSATDSYIVTYQPGDPSLGSNATNYSEYPLRVTVTSVGTSIDPGRPGVTSSSQAQAVLRLIPRALSAAPSNWSSMTSYTLCQLTSDEVSLAVPCHIEGPVRLRGGVDIADAYSWGTSKRNRYLGDLYGMINGINEVQTIVRSLVLGGTFNLSFNGATTGNIAWNASAATVQTALQNLSTIGAGNCSVASGAGTWVVTFTGTLASTNVPAITVGGGGLLGLGASITVNVSNQGIPGTPDYRPFSGPLTLPTSLTDYENSGLLTSQLALTLISGGYSSITAPPISNATTYRMYPGGPIYNAAAVAGSISNTTLTRDPLTNPLGIFYNAGNISVGSNVTIVGTLASGGTITMTGNNIQISPLDLTSLDGDSKAVNLPAVVAVGSLQISSGANATLNGVVYAGQNFQAITGSENTTLTITGNLIVGDKFLIDERSEWKAYRNAQWDMFYGFFNAQLSLPTGIPFFPQFLAATTGRSYVPSINIKPNLDPPVRHWANLNNPLYAVGSSDTGLHWDLVSWSDNP